jgi:uncharacterized membrane protein
MANLFRALQFLGLSIWLGSDVFLSFVVAPGAFKVLASRDQAGAIVGYSLTRMHWIGIACGLLILLVRAVRTFRFSSRTYGAATACIVLMILLTVVSELAVSPKMAQLRRRVGSIEHAGAADARAVEEFAKLHRVSVSLESGVLLAGVAALFLFVRER